MYLTKKDLPANMHRFYRINIVQGLLADWGLMREWGRMGTLRTDWFDTEAEAKDARVELHMEKAKRGYE